MHFVADIHQPLHVGRQEDRGGNTIRVTYFRGTGAPPGRSNLHRYWDSDALDPAALDTDEYAKRLLAKNERRKVSWNPGRAKVWVGEAMLLRPSIYNFDPPGDYESVYLNSTYLNGAQQLLEQRLYLAGRRLGAMLNYRYCVAVEDGPDAEKPAK